MSAGCGSSGLIRRYEAMDAAVRADEAADRVVARAVDSAFRCDVCGERCTSKGALDAHAATFR